MPFVTNGRAEVLPAASLKSAIHVKNLLSNFPSLSVLHKFLCRHDSLGAACRIVAIDFYEDSSRSEPRPIAPCDLVYEIDSSPSGQAQSQASSVPTVRGRLMIVEDPSKDIMDLMISYPKLEISPRFFSLHLHNARDGGTHSQPPSEALLQSQYSSLGFMNIQYHRAIVGDGIEVSGRKFFRDTNNVRKVVFMNETVVGLAHGCVSVIVVKPEADFWLSMSTPNLEASIITTNCFYKLSYSLILA
jgi:hypothetical protein